MKVTIIYTSMTGNTKETADLLEQEFTRRGHTTSSVNIFNETVSHEDIESADLVLLGAYTWGEGKLPIEMRKFLIETVKENNVKYPTSAIFGTGETQWTHYCRAVDEIKYHLSKVTDVLEDTLKIEQAPRRNQIHLITEFVDKLSKGVDA